MNKQHILEWVSKGSLYALVFLLPLWFLPFTQNAVAYPKQVLLVILVFVGLISLLATTLRTGKVELVWSWIHVPVLAVVGVVGLSSFFSLAPATSFFAFPLGIEEGFLTVAVFAIAYLLFIHRIQSIRELEILFSVMVGSFALAHVWAFVQLQGAFLPFEFIRDIGFNTIGSFNNVAITGAVLLPLALAFSFYAPIWRKVLLWGSGMVFFGTLLVANFFAAWAVMLAGFVVMLVFSMANMRGKNTFGWISLPMALVCVAFFFLVFRIDLPGFPAVPVEVSPSYEASIDIARQTLQEHALLGSGPGTFVFDYAKYHSPVLNQTIFWGTRFSSGAAEIIDWVTTKGILGLLAWVGVVGITVWILGRSLVGARLSAEEERGDVNRYHKWAVQLGVGSAFMGLVVSQIVYPSGFLVWFLFWITLGAIVVVTTMRRRAVSIAADSLVAPIFSFVFLLVTIFGLGLLFLVGQQYVAELRYVQAVRVSGEGNIEQTIRGVGSAARLRGSVDLYWRDLAQLHLARANQIAAREDMPEEERQQLQIAAIRSAIVAAQQATIVSPNNVANWNVQGFIYRNLIGLQGAEQAALAAYEKAMELEPASPFAFTEAGRVLVLQAQRLAGEQQEEARQGVLVVAVERLTEAATLKPDYILARYLRAVAYDQQGEVELAIQEFEIVAQLSPEDEQIQQILENLRAGRVGLQEGITPTEPESEEFPPELEGETVVIEDETPDGDEETEE